MKNAYVIDDHHGDNGTVRAGMVLTDLSDQRFAALEKRGFIREATGAELKASGADPSDAKEAPKPADKSAPKPADKAAPPADNKSAPKANDKA